MSKFRTLRHILGQYQSLNLVKEETCLALFLTAANEYHTAFSSTNSNLRQRCKQDPRLQESCSVTARKEHTVSVKVEPFTFGTVLQQHPPLTNTGFAVHSKSFELPQCFYVLLVKLSSPIWINVIPSGSGITPSKSSLLTKRQDRCLNCKRRVTIIAAMTIINWVILLQTSLLSATAQHVPRFSNNTSRDPRLSAKYLPASTALRQSLRHFLDLLYKLSSCALSNAFVTRVTQATTRSKSGKNAKAHCWDGCHAQCQDRHLWGYGDILAIPAK